MASKFTAIRGEGASRCGDTRARPSGTAGPNGAARARPNGTARGARPYKTASKNKTEWDGTREEPTRRQRGGKPEWGGVRDMEESERGREEAQGKRVPVLGSIQGQVVACPSTVGARGLYIHTGTASSAQTLPSCNLPLLALHRCPGTAPAPANVAFRPRIFM